METIIVDKDLCTRCGICSEICITNIIEPGDESSLPQVSDDMAAICVRCGHCEAFCPTKALLLNFRPEEKQILPQDAGIIRSEEHTSELQSH